MTTRVLLYKAGKDIVGRAISYFTMSEWAHVAIYVRGATYEQTWPGVTKTVGCKSADMVLVPPAIADSAETRMLLWLEEQASRKVRYNWMKLVVFAVVYPLRWFFARLGWMPFQSALFGEVCSTFVDQALFIAGVDLFPQRDEESTVPGDFYDCRALELEEGVLP